jgi:hypothetical protein
VVSFELGCGADDSEHLAVDVEMCSLVLELRQKEKELAKMNNEMKVRTFQSN